MNSKHYLVLNALRDTVAAASVLTALIPDADWKISKRFWARGKTWEPGGWVIPMRRTLPTFENSILRVDLPCLIGVVFPSDGETAFDESRDEPRMAACEYLELMFTNVAKRNFPAPITAINSPGSGIDHFTVENLTAQPGDQYIEAVAGGFESYGIIVNVSIITAKQDFSTIGA